VHNGNGSMSRTGISIVRGRGKLVSHVQRHLVIGWGLRLSSSSSPALANLLIE
jgi:hypothetical protein